MWSASKRRHNPALSFALCALFFLLPVFSFGAGGVIITEISYDLAGADDTHEWVELYNTTPGVVDLTGWRFNDGTNHLLNVPPEKGGQGSLVVPAGGIALLTDDAAQFLLDHPGFSGTVIDTVMSLNNTHDTLTLLDESGALVETVTYQKEWGAAGNGRTLEKTNNDWRESDVAGGTPGINSIPVEPSPVLSPPPPAPPKESPQNSPSSPAQPVESSNPPPAEPSTTQEQTTLQISPLSQAPEVSAVPVVSDPNPTVSAPVLFQALAGSVSQPAAPHVDTVVVAQAQEPPVAAAGESPKENEIDRNAVPMQTAVVQNAFRWNIYLLVLGVAVALFAGVKYFQLKSRRPAEKD
ncbi:MAG: lamin tail domain-containing protein [Patescibacteria group bacterium]